MELIQFQIRVSEFYVIATQRGAYAKVNFKYDGKYVSTSMEKNAIFGWHGFPVEK